MKVGIIWTMPMLGGMENLFLFFFLEFIRN